MECITNYLKKEKSIMLEANSNAVTGTKKQHFILIKSDQSRFTVSCL